jgi:hypothetical protein
MFASRTTVSILSPSGSHEERSILPVRIFKRCDTSAKMDDVQIMREYEMARMSNREGVAALPSDAAHRIAKALGIGVSD